MSSGFRVVREQLALISLTLAIWLTASCGAAKPPGHDVGMRNVAEGAAIEGIAAYCERLALPPDAVFEAVLQDVAIADASATEIARTTIPRASDSPIRFSIGFDPLRIDPALPVNHLVM